MRTPDEAKALIKRAEGFHRRLPDGRAAPYLCPANIWTIGWGSTRDLQGAPITRDTPPVTVEEAELLFGRDLRLFEEGVRRLVSVPLTNNQFGALVSFAYNLGLGRLRSSTLLRRLNAGRYEDAANEFPKWVMAGGRRLPGLVIRREQERVLFLKPDSAGPPADSATDRHATTGDGGSWISRFLRAFQRGAEGSVWAGRF
jgi:lysozyme